MKPNRRDAYLLLHQGAIALSELSANGIRVDVDYLNEAYEEGRRKITEIEEELQEDSLWSDWEETFGAKANIGARAQLGKVLFDALGYEIREDGKTEKGNTKTDATTLEQIDLPFVKRWLECEKLKKGVNTFLSGIRREVVDGRLHPSYSLNIARTYRSASSNPNAQNWPIRDPEMGQMIRRCFIADPGYLLVEVDYGQIEVRVAACYNHDPVLIDYICDESKDMHRDMAAELFLLPEKVPKDFWKGDGKKMRFFTKNQFVFPQFYGSYYLECAKNLWESMLHHDFKIGDLPVQQHLRQEGIKRRGACRPEMRPMRGTFEDHVRKVEREFWDQRFSVYRDWKVKWFQAYVKKGYYDTLTGFRVGGVMRKNDVINYGIQGSAFHCLLWSLIQLRERMRKRKMRSRLIGQIHDSMLAEVHEDELADFLWMARDIMVEEIRQHWEWISVPLKVEAEVAPAGKSWYDKKGVPINV